MLIFHGPNYDNMSMEEIEGRLANWGTWVEKLSESGRYHSGEGLDAGGKDVKGTTGEIVTDGPYTEGSEVVGGYMVIDAKDYDDAVSMSRDFPDFDLGGYVQVRKVMKYEE